MVDHGGADADAGVAHGGQLGDGVTQPQGHDAAGISGCDDHELVLAEARHGIEQPDPIGDGAGHVSQHLVRDTRALALADVGEPVDIQHRDRQRRALSGSAGDLQLQHALEGDAVSEAGEPVGVRQAIGVVRSFPDRVAQPRLADGHGGQVGDGQDGVRDLLDGGFRRAPAHDHEAFDEGTVLVLDHQRREHRGARVGQHARKRLGGPAHDQRLTIGDRPRGVRVRGGDGQRQLAVEGEQHVSISVVEQEDHGAGVRDGLRLLGQGGQLGIEGSSTGHHAGGVEKAEGHGSLGHGRDDRPTAGRCQHRGAGGLRPPARERTAFPLSPARRPRPGACGSRRGRRCRR